MFFTEMDSAMDTNSSSSTSTTSVVTPSTSLSSFPVVALIRGLDVRYYDVIVAAAKASQIQFCPRKSRKGNVSFYFADEESRNAFLVSNQFLHVNEVKVRLVDPTAKMEPPNIQIDISSPKLAFASDIVIREKLANSSMLLSVGKPSFQSVFQLYKTDKFVLSKSSAPENSASTISIDPDDESHLKRLKTGRVSFLCFSSSSFDEISTEILSMDLISD